MKLFNKIFEKQISRFVAVGILNTIIGVGSYFILLDFNIYYLLSSLIAHMIGVTNSFIWNKKWTFRTNGNILKEFLKFNTVYAVAFFVNLLLLVLFVEKFEFNPKISGVFSLGIIAMISFFGHKYWSFRL
jgi:putative flippase GtrA